MAANTALPVTLRRHTFVRDDIYAGPADAQACTGTVARVRRLPGEVFGGEDRDTWLLAAGREIPTTFSPSKLPRGTAAA
jgi:hypothetical protein